jgi:hypothetical protein
MPWPEVNLLLTDATGAKPPFRALIRLHDAGRQRRSRYHSSNSHLVDFLSKRVGNHQADPALDLIADQVSDRQGRR